MTFFNSCSYSIFVFILISWASFYECCHFLKKFIPFYLIKMEVFNTYYINLYLIMLTAFLTSWFLQQVFSNWGLKKISKTRTMSVYRDIQENCKRSGAVKKRWQVSPISIHVYRASGKNDEVWNELVQRRNKIIT